MRYFVDKFVSITLKILCFPSRSTIPLCLWFFVVRDASVFMDALIQVYRNSLLVPTIVIIVGLVIGTELLVAAFFFRSVEVEVLFSALLHLTSYRDHMNNHW